MGLYARECYLNVLLGRRAIEAPATVPPTEAKGGTGLGLASEPLTSVTARELEGYVKFGLGEK
jgi:hypothetical protein